MGQSDHWAPHRTDGASKTPLSRRVVRRHNLVNALALAAVVLSPMSADAAKPTPPVVKRFLGSNPSLRLLQLSDVRDILDSGGEGQFSPFVEADLTGDSRPDVAAVVVQPGSPMRYGVVAFNRSDIRPGPSR